MKVITETSHAHLITFSNIDVDTGVDCHCLNF